VASRKRGGVHLRTPVTGLAAAGSGCTRGLPARGCCLPHSASLPRWPAIGAGFEPVIIQWTALTVIRRPVLAPA